MHWDLGRVLGSESEVWVTSSSGLEPWGWEYPDSGHSMAQTALGLAPAATLHSPGPACHKISSGHSTMLAITLLLLSPRPSYFDACYNGNVVTEHRTEPAESHTPLPSLHFFGFAHTSYFWKNIKIDWDTVTLFVLLISSATWIVTPQTLLRTFSLEKITI